jgi:hypothetical protein
MRWSCLSLTDPPHRVVACIGVSAKPAFGSDVVEATEGAIATVTRWNSKGSGNKHAFHPNPSLPALSLPCCVPIPRGNTGSRMTLAYCGYMRADLITKSGLCESGVISSICNGFAHGCLYQTGSIKILAKPLLRNNRYDIDHEAPTIQLDHVSIKLQY